MERIFGIILVVLVTGSGCQPFSAVERSEDHQQAGREVASEIETPGLDQQPVLEKGRRFILNQTMTLRYEKSGVLETLAELPVGTVLLVPHSSQIAQNDFRASNGSVQRSSTGFVHPIEILSLPSSLSGASQKLSQWNNHPGGLFIAASMLSALDGTEGSYTPITSAKPGNSDFQGLFEATGRPSFSYKASVARRFGNQINRGPASLSTAESLKYTRIYEELKKALNREVSTPKSYLLIARSEAQQRSLDFEKTGRVSNTGAWSIAVLGTATRRGFANVPCAEFMSEVIRQAYQRAGYPVTEDFNTSRGNSLIWSKTAAVVGLSSALHKAGWVPWDPQVYKPITGSIMMHGSGLSPGHTYASGSSDGVIIVDNGSPQGRDLRKTSGRIIQMMYKTGVFFLPPGIQPPRW